jgi:N-acetylmuramoyl-L-alanine amidase
MADPLVPVQLRVDGKALSLNTHPVTDGRDVYIPLEALQAFKVPYRLSSREDCVIIMLTSGKEAEIALARPGKEKMVPLSTFLEHLKWEARLDKGVCEVRSVSSHKTQKPQEEKTPKGTKSTETTAQPTLVTPANRPAPAESRPEPAEKLVHPSPLSHAATKNPSSEITLTLTLPPTQPAKETKPAEAPPSIPPNQPVQNAEPVDSTKVLPSRGGTIGLTRKGAARIQDVQFHVIDNNHAQLKVISEGKLTPTATLMRSPTRLTIDLPNAALDVSEREWDLEHPFATHIYLMEGNPPGTVRIVMRLARLIGYEIVSVGPTGFTVNLSLPRGAGRRMKDLIVVVDPGHGGRSSTGCSFMANGVCIYEKNLTLSIASKLQKLLTAAGVTVLMTRTEDVEVPLKARPALATENNADFFISIHIDDCPIPNSASGSTAYYHKNDPSSRALAHSIVEQIRQVSGLPVRGAKSDGVLYTNGLAVLRNSTVPAVLIEVGYINHARDRQKLLNEVFQQRVAQAIVAGIRGYVEGILPEDTPLGVDDN